MAGTEQIRTLRQFLESDQVIDCDCSNYWVCSHSGTLKIEMAIERLGWNFDFYSGREQLAARVYCSLCGWRRPTFRLGWKERPATYTGSHGGGMNVRTIASRPSPQWNEPADWRQGGDGLRKFGPRR
jgi:hypothetical protein